MKDFVEVTGKNRQMQKADTVIVLPMPFETSGPALDVLNEITKRIINSDFANTLKQCNKEKIIIEVNSVLDHFIQLKGDKITT